MKKPPCPECGSNNVAWNSKVTGRLRCTDCGRWFRTTARDKTSTQTAQKIKEQEQQIEKLEESITHLTTLKTKKLNPPTWETQKTRGNHIAVATAFLSDTHFDEVVNPEEIGNANAYNRKIAAARLKRFFQNTICLCDEFINGIKIEGLVLALGGDIVSGNIHEELARTNDAPIMDTILFWSDRLAAGIELLSQRFPYLMIPAVTGNHGRNTKKPIHKGRARDNFDYLIYKLLEKHFLKNKNIKFLISEGTDISWKIYNTRYQMTHGDQFRGGSGIAGIATPIKLGAYRKQRREATLGNPFDVLLMGHFHQYTDFGDIIINGSLKGYDEFAAANNLAFEPPQQAFWLTDPKKGKTIRAPIHVTAENEKWSQKA